jgi:hypothetical protein
MPQPEALDAHHIEHSKPLAPGLPVPLNARHQPGDQKGLIHDTTDEVGR